MLCLWDNIIQKMMHAKRKYINWTGNLFAPHNSMLIGKSEIMDKMPDIFVTGTYFTDELSVGEAIFEKLNEMQLSAKNPVSISSVGNTDIFCLCIYIKPENNPVANPP